ncbi:MAG: fibronectin type III domain-containing protein [Synechococcus sp. SB0662_bin_14]|nr:fibronectin type III domain-containing protein [Synechococcus sp. SB0662_bin_14]
MSLRGSVLSLALLLGASAAFLGCGEDEVPTPTTPEPPPVPAPPAPEPTLTTPENLRVTNRGPDYIEWSWNAVAGAPAYQAQFSTGDTFTAADATYLIIAPQTSHRVESLPDNTTGYLRVRSAGGASLTNREFSDWSEVVRGSTTAPAVALDTPQQFRATDPGEDSVTLRWDPVSGAGSYEVEQREPDGDNEWGGADCEGADPGHLVEGEGCVAGGLDSGTNYDFRVRAVPADTDRHRESAWSAVRETRTAGAGAPPTEPTTGAMGNLNVRWTSDADGIMWTWDRLPGASYDYAIVTGGDLPRRGSSDPCADANYEQFGVADTHAQRAAGPIALLCVRTAHPDRDSENLSFAWAVAPPSPPAVPDATGVSPAGDSAKATRALTWTGIDIEGGFAYEMNVIADPERQNDVTPDRPADEALQRACSAGRFHESGDTDVPLTALETTLTRVEPHTGYLLCLRMKNVAGTTDWVVPDGNAEHQTAPGTPARPTRNDDRSEDDRDAESEKIVWDIETREDLHVPREPGDFILRAIQHPDKTDADGDNFHDNEVARPDAEDCGDSDFQSGDYTNPDVTPALTGQGFSVMLSVPRPTGEQQVASGSTEVIPVVVSLCIQARYGTGAHERLGPWTVSAPETVERKRKQSQ